MFQVCHTMQVHKNLKWLVVTRRTSLNHRTVKIGGSCMHRNGSGALRPDSRKCHKILAEFQVLYFWSYLQNCSRFWLQIFHGDSLGIAPFVGVTTPTCDVITVNKFPGKFAHSENKLSLRRPSSTLPNWLCISYIVDITGIITKSSPDKPECSAF